MKRILLLALMTSSLSMVACQKSGGSTQTPATPPPSSVTGTSSGGGGGNGIDGKALELYSVDIQTLPEYRRYVAPIIDKIAYGQGDVLAVYMKWVVKHKTWYMVNKDLQTLPKEQVGVTFDTEQLARHSEREVYIHAPSYYSPKNKPSDRAELLMHEIVMGARYLMKKSAKEQCETLESSKPQVCSNPEIIASAENPHYSKAEQLIMDNEDTEAVRAMTVFLMHHTQEVTASSVAALRRQLHFVFPWDRLVSTLTPEDAVAAFRRTATVDGPFTSSMPPVAGVPSSCFYDLNTESNAGYIFEVVTASDGKVSEYPQYLKDPGSSQTERSAFRWLDNYSSGDVLNSRDPALEHYIFSEAMGFSTLKDFSVKGVSDPIHPGQIADLVTFSQNIDVTQAQWESERNAGNSYSHKRIQALISREDQPRVLKIFVYNIHLVFHSADHKVNSESDYEVTVDKNPEFTCSPK